MSGCVMDPSEPASRGGGHAMNRSQRRRDTTPVQFNQRLALLLAMAMFVLVVDTSIMNVSISAVVKDIDSTVSGLQSTIALEALVSAAFILIGGKSRRPDRAQTRLRHWACAATPSAPWR